MSQHLGRNNKRRPLYLEALEDRTTPASLFDPTRTLSALHIDLVNKLAAVRQSLPAGSMQLQALEAQVSAASAAHSNLDARVRGLGRSPSVNRVAHVVSAVLHGHQNTLVANARDTSFPAATQQILGQSFNVLTQGINSFESWYFRSTSAKASADTLLTQLDAFTRAFQQAEQAQIQAQVSQYTSGQTMANNNTAFVFPDPSFWNRSQNRFADQLLPGAGGQAFSTAPVVVTQPTSATVNAGQTATFTVDASGAPTPSIQWQVSTNNGTSFSNLADGSGISGATTSTLTVSSTTSSQNGSRYRALVTNAGGSTTSAASTLTVNFAPQVSTQPADKTGVAGGSVSFVAAASASPSAAVRWQVSTNDGSTFTDLADGSGVSGSGTTTLTLSALTAAQTASRYRAVFTNAAGSATSSAATLTVNTAPQVTVQPASKSGVVGGSINFSAAATGAPVPSVKWQVSTNSGSTFTDLSDDAFVAGSGTTTLTLTGLLATQSNNRYRAVFTSSAGSVNSSAATLTVTATQSAPQLTTQPANHTVAPGQTATFTAAASGSPTPTVQWQISTNGGSTFTDLADGNGVSGATTTTLTLTSVTASQNASQYRAVFTNSAGSVNSTAVSLTVTSAPQVTTQPANQSGAVGGSVSFTAASSGVPAPTVRWQVSTDGGTTFTNLSDGSGVAGATTGTLTLSGLAASQTGNRYRAVFTNFVGSATSADATLTVTPAVAPQVTTQPANQTAAGGQSATFTAAASGDPTPSVQWQISSDGGITFTNLTNGSGVAGATTPTLTLSGLTAAQNSTRYRAVFTNAGGNATTSAATLTVTPVAPQVTTQPSNQTAPAGQSATFTAAASGDPAPTVQWQVSTDGGTTFTNLANGSGVAGATTPTVTLSGLTAGQNTTRYRAVFTNTAGSINTNGAVLTVT